MVRALCLMLVALAAPAWAGDGSAQLEACNEQLLDCKENCTIDYGTSVKKRAQLMKCVKKCNKKVTTCRARTLELRQVGIDIPDEKPKKKKDEETASARTPIEEAPPPPPKEEEEKPAPVVEKEEERPVEKKVEKKQAPPPPKEEVKPVEEKPKKKKALDEWDEGDIDR